MNSLQAEWPEPIVRVQTLSESGLGRIPAQYIKPITERPTIAAEAHQAVAVEEEEKNHIPLINLEALLSGDPATAQATMDRVGEACREWGFFQAVNHGVHPALMDRARLVWRDFFHQPMEVKQKYANSPATYEGYGSKLGVEKGAILDWSDYYFLHYLPSSLKDHNKWPDQPLCHRDVIEEYMGELVKLSERLMKIFSTNLGLKEDYLQNAFGGENVGACLRANFYPKCPQPDLTLGLSSHSDPGGLTILLPDQDVPGLQVRKDGKWITVKPAPHAFIVNIGDQIQVLSNATYKSVEHRVIVNPNFERVSIAFFYNPRGDLQLEPAKELVSPENPSLYLPMTYNEYRLYIRLKGTQGKFQVESLKSPR